MQKTCKKCNSNFEITDKDLEFYDKISPVFNGKKYKIPTPTLCPDCRQQRRLAFRNERKLYKRKCDATGESIISVYSPDKPFKVYNHNFWWSDNWEPLDYGIDFDPSKSFFEQFKKLSNEVPKLALIINDTMKNSSFANYGNFGNNIYMGFVVHSSENIYYSYTSVFCNYDVDGSFNKESENLYECIGCNNSYKLFYSKDSENCKNSYFLHFCKNCENCFGCVNLINKKYCIFNKQYSKEEYFKKIKEILNKNIETIKDEFFKFLKKQFFKNLIIKNSQNSIGDYLYNCKDCENCFEFSLGENCKNIFSGYGKITDSCDINYIGGNCFKNIDSITIINSSKILFSNYSKDSNNLVYCDFCNSCENCFGCVGLKNKQYCILNKQYTKEEYEELVPKIIEHMQKTGEWGEFFPASLSPFGYNETVAGEYFPLNKEEILRQNFNYSDYEPPFPKVEKVIPAKKLPEDISKIPDDILNWAIECEVSKKPFRIIKQELEFYRKHNLPIPKKHPDIRHSERMKLRNPRKLFDRKCDKCGIEIKSTYSPDREEIVYCEKCYEKEVY